MKLMKKNQNINRNGKKQQNVSHRIEKNIGNKIWDILLWH